MSSPRPCPECGRLATRFTRTVCHSICYKRHKREGTVESLPNAHRQLQDKVSKTVEDYLRMVEEDPGLTQAECSRRLGISPAALSHALLRRGIRETRLGRKYRTRRDLEDEYDYA